MFSLWRLFFFFFFGGRLGRECPSGKVVGARNFFLTKRRSSNLYHCRVMLRCLLQVAVSLFGGEKGFGASACLRKLLKALGCFARSACRACTTFQTHGRKNLRVFGFNSQQAFRNPTG